MQAKHARRQAEKLAAEDQLIQEVFDQLSHTCGITGAARETVGRAQREIAEKRSALHKDWNQQVYKEIAGRIQHAVNARNVQDIEQRLQSNSKVRTHSWPSVPGTPHLCASSLGNGVHAMLPFRWQSIVSQFASWDTLKWKRRPPWSTPWWSALCACAGIRGRAQHQARCFP